MVDPVLGLAKSFRAGWGPNGLLAHNGQVCPPAKQVLQPEAPGTSLSSIKVETIKLAKDGNAQSAQQMLERQMEHTEIDFDEDFGVPAAFAADNLRFKHFAGGFAPNDKSHEALIWRLGRALFDEIDLGLSNAMPMELRTAAMNLRRKAALSAWLAVAVSAAADNDARTHQASGKVASQIFAYLTGHQVERAAVLAADAKRDVGETASIMGAQIESTIGVPLWHGDEEIIGVLQVDNRDASGVFRERDLDRLSRGAQRGAAGPGPAAAVDGALL